MGLLRSRWIVVATCVGVAVLGMSSLPANARSGPKTASADARLDAALHALVAESGGPPGIVVVVQRRGDIGVHVQGVADVTTGQAATADDHTRIASVSKAFSGAAALSLVSQGVLSLDDTIGEWVPTLPRPWHRVTLAELLHHTSGISDFSDNPKFLDALFASLLVAPAPKTLLTYAHRKLDFTPGSEYHYSNSDNIVVGLIVAAATHESYEDALASLVYGPMGLHDTSLPSDASIPAPFIHGYKVAPPAAPEDDSNLFAAGWTWASGGIVSTPGDANRFIRAYVGGATINPRTQARQFQFRAGSSEPPGPGENAAGLALFRYGTPCGTVYGHTGNTSGYTEFVAANRNGTRSTSVSVNAQITPKTNPQMFEELRAIFGLAVCAALA
jgi:D-alanyl-D-alanine carboxypeptidase